MPKDEAKDYAQEVNEMMQRWQATALALFVVGGERGNGYQISINPEKEEPRQAMRKMASALRKIADQLDTDAGEYLA